MPGPFEDVVSLDRIVHEPARLAILTALEACRSADFVFLQNLLGLTNGNASAHLAKLEEAGLVDVTKTFKGRMPRTMYKLTRLGRTSLQRHWQQLDELRHAAGTLVFNPE
jgi:DNA-binding transcriptional ArsR family regulator